MQLSWAVMAGRTANQDGIEIKTGDVSRAIDELVNAFDWKVLIIDAREFDKSAYVEQFAPPDEQVVGERLSEEDISSEISSAYLQKMREILTDEHVSPNEGFTYPDVDAGLVAQGFDAVLYTGIDEVSDVVRRQMERFIIADMKPEMTMKEYYDVVWNGSVMVVGNEFSLAASDHEVIAEMERFETVF